MYTEHDIEKKITASRPTLDDSSRARLWSQIEAKLPTARGMVSPFVYTFMFTQKRTMVPLAIVLAVLVSTGGVAAAAETARPGDALYPVERAFENVRLKVALSAESKNTLLKKYSEERLVELRDIIDEETRLRKVDDNSARFDDAGTLRSLSIEADVFTDVTVIHIELNDTKSTFTAGAKTRNDIAEAVLLRYPFLTKGQVESALTIEDEDRSSRAKDRGEVELTSEGSVRVGSALTEVLTFIDESEDDDDDTDRFLMKLQAEIDGLNVQIDDKRVKSRGVKSRFEWKTDRNDMAEEEIDEKKIDAVSEWYDEGARVRIEEKDGRVRIDIKERDGWDDDHANDDDSNKGDDRNTEEEEDADDENTSD